LLIQIIATYIPLVKHHSNYVEIRHNYRNQQACRQESIGLISNHGIQEVFGLLDVLDKFGHLSTSSYCNYLLSAWLESLLWKEDQRILGLFILLAYILAKEYNLEYSYRLFYKYLFYHVVP